MTAFAISQAEILDENLAARYRVLARASVSQHSGRYIINGTPAAAEGTWDARQRLIVIEFETMQHLRDWYTSPGYAAAKQVASRALSRQLLFINGLDDHEY